MTNLAFSTNAFKKSTLEESIDAIAAIGYAGVEVMADVPHALPSKMDLQRRKDLLQRIHDHGQRVSNINSFTLFACGDTYHPTWIEDDAAKRQTRIDHTIASIELAAELGAKTISLQPGGPMIGTTMTREEAGRRYADGLSKILPAAKSCNVTLAIEPEPGLFIETSEEYSEFKQKFFATEPTVKMNCDLGHLFCVGEDPADVVRRLSKDIAHVHLEDIGKNRVHQHLTPGKGAMDFKSIFTALSDVNYQGWITVELYPYETTAAGVARAAWDYLTTLNPNVPPANEYIR